MREVESREEDGKEWLPQRTVHCLILVTSVMLRWREEGGRWFLPTVKKQSNSTNPQTRPRFDIRHANARLSTHQEPQGTGNGEQGTGNGEWQLGERECGNKERGEGQVEECGDEGATNI